MNYHVPSQTSRVIDFLRFPLIVGIVAIHAWSATAFPADYTANLIIQFFRSEICRIFVPLFFTISGYLFFVRYDGGTLDFYKRQWRRRLFTLLVPYLLWNLIAWGFEALKMVPPFDSLFPNVRPIPFNPESIWRVFWGYSTEISRTYFYEPSYVPMDFPLWFIRDLMVIVLFTPLIALCLKKRRGIISLAILMVLFAGGLWPSFFQVQSTGVVFFCLGAYFSINRKDPLAFTSRFGGKKLLLPGILWLCLALTDLFFAPSYIADRCHGLEIILGTPLVAAVVSEIVSRGKSIPSLLANTSFIVFAYHGLICIQVIKILEGIIHPSATISIIALYFLTILSLTAGGVILYYLLKVCPPALRLLTGDRVISGKSCQSAPTS